MQRIRTNNKGFTLVEILIVVIILGILAAIVIPQFSNASTDAKKNSLTSQLQTMRSQMELYKLQHNDKCPTKLEANGLHGLMPVLTGDLDADEIRRIVAEFPEVAGFGIGTKLSGEVRRIAGVIFKECVIDGRPTLKASNTPEKSTLPGRLQVFRGVDKEGRYVADVTGLDDEEVSIPGASRVERLLFPFWVGGWHESIPSILKQKAFVEEQLRRFPDINNYPHALSDRLSTLRDELTARMRADESGWQQILNVPEPLAAGLPLEEYRA